MTYLARCLHAIERNPDDWVDAVDLPKKLVSNNTRRRSTNTGVPHVSTNLVETTTGTVLTTKLNNPTYNYTATGKTDYS